MIQAIYETYSRDEPMIRASERSFGIIMAAAFGIISLFNWWHGGHAWYWSSGVATFFLAAALCYPSALTLLNRLWLKLGLLLHKVASPIVMALLFFGSVLPTGLIMRALGNDLLRLKWEPDASSYWIERRPAGPAPESMKDQF